MPGLEDHPTVKRFRGKPSGPASGTLSGEELRQLCIAAGADDVGFVSLDRDELADQRADILHAFPATSSLISFVCRMNRDPVRSPARSVANAEFHQTVDHVNEVAHEIVRQLEDRGIRAMNPAAGFPMEMSQFPEKI
jgi:hypothetical protein